MGVFLTSAIQALQGLDFFDWMCTGFMILAGVIAIIEIIGKASKIIGKPVKWVRKKEEDHELLMKTVEGLTELKKRHEEDNQVCARHDDEIRSDLKKLTDMFIEKEINDYRWEIINFATRVSEGKPCNKESYKHCFKTYNDYERLLEENDLENGEVEVSMEIIREGYKKKMSEGI